MTRRLLIQFGVAAFSLAVTSGIASADSQSGTAATTANLVQQDTSGATSNVTSNYSLSTTVGPGSGTNQSGGGTGSGSPTGGGSSAPGGSGGSGAALLQSPNGTAPGAQTLGTPDGSATQTGQDSSQPSSAAVTTNTPPSTPPAGSGSDSGSGGPGALYSNQPVNIAQLVQQASVAVAASANPPRLVADTNPSVPTPPSSGLPRNAAGFLAEFPLLMAQVMIPVVHILPLGSLPIALAITLAAIIVTAAIAALAGLLNQLSRNTHTARLRRSGFLGAARSDVGAALLLFATPPEMSSILVPAT